MRHLSVKLNKHCAELKHINPTSFSGTVCSIRDQMLKKVKKEKEKEKKKGGMSENFCLKFEV